ncbi:VOC family protein [Gordonia zhaorongruii]|uniref:VOC family protein n=1 Tax=Gordonia zhaorongruii TaxID=2597659 RepID=UPI001180545D|nr:VOC family protein [Gordonia zhaorongruii]
MPNLNPYVSFKDTARQAMEFYQQALGGDLDISTFEAFPDMVDPSEAANVMHAQLTTEDGLVLMASDTPSTMGYQPPQGISVSLSGPDVDKLRTWWDKLSEGGEPTMPFAEAPWGGYFGMFTDRFGIAWMVASSE